MSLTAFQRRVARLFFELPESEGFAVAGGAALIARDLIDRATRDLDLFADPPADVHEAAGALEDAVGRKGWSCHRVRTEWAAARDAGFAAHLLVDALRGHERWSDDELRAGGVDPSDLRTFFDGWADELA